MDDAPRTFPVSKYLTSIKRLLESKVPDVWVNGVISQISDRGKVIYLNIAEFEEGNVKPVAALPLYLFAFEYARLISKLSELPAPFSLKEGLKVNLLVKADIYVPYGKLQAHVLDIDPAFTIGELALTRQAILKRLKDEGLLRRNAECAFADVPLRVGLITGESTAAYKDFTTTLESSGYAFRITAAFAKMQGNETETTVLAAIGKLRAERGLDVICIVRGGGSKTDLNFFDSEALCRAVALCDIPVLTGIGHEIDQSLLDLTAYEACITPTDCAKRLIHQVELTWNKTQTLATGIAGGVRLRIARAGESLERIRGGLIGSVSARTVKERGKLDSAQKELSKSPFRLLKDEQGRIDRDRDGLTIGAQKILTLEKSRFALVEERVKTADPKRILAKGYSFTTGKSGKPLRNAHEVHPGDVLVTRFADGQVESVAK